MDLTFTGDIWHWRGPAPFHFVTVPDNESAHLESLSRAVTYGWGMIPVEVRIGSTKWTTSLYPKNGGYVLPVKDKIRAAESLEIGDTVTVTLTVAPRR